jgi:PAS domain S-box-containing protein
MLRARRAAETSLRESEERYRSMVETTYDWIWEVDAAGAYTYASPKSQDLLGYSPAEVLGKTPFDFMPASEARRVRTLWEEAVGHRKTFSGLENINTHKDGHEVVLETSGVPVFGPKGEFRGYRGMDRDITERKRLEAQLRQAQKLEAIGQLAGGVAHDFNNILAAIMMHLGLLQMNPDLDEETLSVLKDIDSEARRAAGLTRQLLMFSRRSVLSLKPLAVNDIIANLLKMLTRLIGEHISLRFDSGTALPLVEADAGMIEQVIMNLVVNARDSMPKGGRVTISTSVTEPNSDRARDLGGGEFLRLAVSDTGCGMDAATLKRMFEPFFTTKEVGKGTGLGLATVHGIVAQHKGWVEVSSELGVGTTFSVYLPVLKQPVGEAVEVLPQKTMPRGKETVLLVEDESSVRNLVSKMLRNLGYVVHEAGSGQAAMRVWQVFGHRVDLLFTDMVMPEGMTGLELTEQLQGMKPSLKAVISSGYSAEIVQAGVPSKKGVVYLPKPYDSAVLAQVVRECLDGKNRRDTVSGDLANADRI